VIHILYNGQEDVEFRQWLLNKGVIVHNHNPTWTDKIEEMRLNGDPAASHLFLHAGNYFGTWQRIDIPLFVESEYVLLLDSDTVIRKSFTLNDFGLNLTRGIAMSSEMNADDKTPSNAGVTLMNIPHLRHTYHDFLAFILDHVETAKFDHPSPSDQGAYLVFYKDTTKFLSRNFNFKPYWQLPEHEFWRVYIIHFHGPKPHDYMRYVMGKGCSTAVLSLCRASQTFPFLCRSLHHFARASRLVDETIYCESSFESTNQVAFCNNLFDDLAQHGSNCLSFSNFAWEVLRQMPPGMKLPREVIRKKLGISLIKKFGIVQVYTMFLLFWGIAAATFCRFSDRRRAFLALLFLWALGTSTIAYSALTDYETSHNLRKKAVVVAH
jgi:hypothetical protein